MTAIKASSGQAGFEKVVVITRKTRLAELVERFNTRAQAKFYIEHAGGDFREYELEDDVYRGATETVRRSVEVGLKVQLVDRSLVPTFTFLPQDIVVTLGQDGLVANTAKYVGRQPIVAVNPDRERFDGILLPFSPEQTKEMVEKVARQQYRVRPVTLAEARTNDGQRVLAFNDLFIGAQSHVSARYRIKWAGASEPQSSSGILISTGAGSTGWMSSVFNMTAGVEALLGGRKMKPVYFPWEDRRLLFVVREPFVSKHSKADVVAGWIEASHKLELESQMPSGGVIFSDGMEADYVAFNSGTQVTVGAAAEAAQLVAG